VSIASLAEAREYLNFTSDTSHDTELQRFIDAADPVIEDIVGPVNTVQVTEWYDGGRPYIVLRQNPVVTVDSITEYSGATGTALTATTSPADAGSWTYTFDTDDGILYRVTSAGSSFFANGANNVKVVYTVGRSPVPTNIKLAALELIRHLYQSTQQGGRPQFGGAGEEGPWAPAGFAVPTRVIELLAPHRRERRIA
jgi:hypothetical protein